MFCMLQVCPRGISYSVQQTVARLCIFIRSGLSSISRRCTSWDVACYFEYIHCIDMYQVLWTRVLIFGVEKYLWGWNMFSGHFTNIPCVCEAFSLYSMRFAWLVSTNLFLLSGNMLTKLPHFYCLGMFSCQCICNTSVMLLGKKTNISRW